MRAIYCDVTRNCRSQWAVYLTCKLCLLGAFGGFGTTTTTAGPAFSFSAPTNTGTSGKTVQV